MMERNLAAEVQQEELLDISIERVDKLDSPLLVIGLGGTGANTVRTVKQTFAARYILPRDGNGNVIPIPKRTAYLVMDTDRNSKGGFGDSEFVNISLPGITQILDPKARDFNMSEFERKWVNKNLNAASHGLGAGTYRQAARFMLSRNYSTVYNAIKGALQNITTVTMGQGNATGRTEIVVVTGICGGTGSGTFLDVAQIIRHCMAVEPNLAGMTYKITGYIVMPDVSLLPINNSALERLLRQNGYAALKELDFWMRVGEHKTPYAMQYSGSKPISWDKPPYDSCILMSAINVSGEAYANGEQIIQKTIAENLLHYLAQEQVNRKADGKVEYTYISYEDNLKATVAAMEKRLPVYYGYRAVGAYTKRIPKKKILYYEGTLLFSSFMPPRDQQNRLVPNPALKQDGKANARAKEITGDIQTLYNNFKVDAKLPNFTAVQASDKDMLDRLRALQPLPHLRVDTNPNPWLTSSINPAVLRASTDFLKASWGRFLAFADSVISDPKLGPFSLRDYLGDPDKGLMPSLNGELNGWKTNASNFRNNVGKRLEDCQNTWANFRNPPLLARNRAVESYLTALVGYYDAVRKSAFMQAYADALDKLVNRIEDYREHVVKPLCEDLEDLQGEFALSQNGADAKLESDLFDLETVKDQINSDFEVNNANEKLTREFLRRLFESSSATTASVDVGGTGLAFQYRVNGKNEALEAIRASLEACFGDINGQSLDSIMVQTVGNDLARQQEYMDEAGKAVIDSAQPLFSQKKAFASEEVAKFNYLSIPDNAVMHIARYQQVFSGQNTTPKGSSLRDHMYCTTAWDGLPLYRYSLIDDLERVYADNLDSPEVSMGVHLVWDGERDSDYTSNWTKLPSPAPFYFFASQGTAQASKTYQEARDLARRARESNMLQVDSSQPVPAYKLRMFYEDAQHRVTSVGDSLIQKIKAIEAAIDPRTGSRMAPGALVEQIKAFLQGAAVESLPCDKKPSVLATMYGLQNAPCDPWDASVIANPASLDAAKKNHVLLSDELAAAVIAANPRVMLAIRQQVAGHEYAQKLLDGFDISSKVWGPRIAYAPRAADMLIHKVLQTSFDGWQYTEANGEQHPVIQQALLAEDLRGVSPLVQVAAYLGDQDQGHLTRAELENQTRNKKDELRERANAKQLKAADLQAMMDEMGKVTSIIDKEMQTHKALSRKTGADVEKEGKILELLQGMLDQINMETDRLKNMMLFL